MQIFNNILTSTIGYKGSLLKGCEPECYTDSDCKGLQGNCLHGYVLSQSMWLGCEIQAEGSPGRM